jgi:transposase-like protein
MINQELKNKAIELRKLGKSYNEISRELGLHNSALSYWFNGLLWSKEIESKNNQKYKQASRERIIAVNAERREKYDLIYVKTKTEALVEFELHKNNPLFVAALMLYLGEGSKLH